MGETRLQSLLIGAPGILQLGPTRHMIVRPELLAEIQKGVEDRLGIKASEYLYAAGSLWATHELRRLRSGAAGLADEELARLFCQHATAMGWGEWRIGSLRHEEKGLLIRLMDSPFAEAYGQSDAPVCHLVAGAVSGLAENLFALPAPCTEMHCRAQGAADCQFAATATDVSGAESWSW